jgi:hypothetical protein
MPIRMSCKHHIDSVENGLPNAANDAKFNALALAVHTGSGGSAGGNLSLRCERTTITFSYM